MQTAREIAKRLRQKKKILIFGNGGSAADAQHIAAELVNRLTKTRPAIPALALTTDSSILTCIANDDDFSRVFSRQIEAFGSCDDVALAISTSGKSQNIINALQQAKLQGLFCIGLLGGSGGDAISLCDISLVVPSNSAQRIQETHITIAHILCEWLELDLFT